MLDMRGLKSSTGHTLCFGRTAGTGEACGRIWLGEVPRHVLSERGAAGAPVRRVFFDAHGQVASQDRLVVGCGEGQCWQEEEQAEEDRSVAAEMVSRGEWEERTLTTPLLVELRNRRTVGHWWIASCCVLQALCSGKLVRSCIFTLLESDSARPCEPIGHLRHFAMPSAHHVLLLLQRYLGRYPPLLHLIAEVR